MNGDGMVDAADLGLLVGAWGTADPNADINGDGDVDAADLGLLIGAWGLCPETAATPLATTSSPSRPGRGGLFMRSHLRSHTPAV